MSSGGSSVASSVPPLGHAIGGAIGSALALLLFYPLERARIEMQSNVVGERQHVVEQREMMELTRADNQDQEDETVKVVDGTESHALSSHGDSQSSSSSAESWVSCLDPSEEESPAEIRQESTHEQSRAIALKASKQQDGLVPTLSRLYERRELYQGAGSIVITLATSNFVFFYAHQMVQGLLSEKNAKKSAIISLFGSSIAGMVNVLLTNPLWCANMRIVKGSHLSLWSELQAIVQLEGWKSLWNGTGASLLLVSNPVLQFFIYDLAKASCLQRTNGNNGAARTTLSPVEAFCVGALAKAVATVTTYPLQLAQVLLRLQKGEGTSTTWDCLKQQYCRGGISALYKGMNAKLLQTVLTAAFTFLTYEQILRAVRLALLMGTTTVQQKRGGRQKVLRDHKESSI